MPQPQTYQFRARTRSKPSAFRASIKTDGPRVFEVVGYDMANRSRAYINRQVFVDGERELLFNLPISPNRIKFEFVDVTDEPGESEIDMKEVALALPVMVMDKVTLDFLKFASIFAERAGELPAGNYKDKSGRFLIKYKENITDHDTGGVINTPARIHKTDDYIEVSKSQLEKETIPGRMIILLHEFSHNFLNEDMDDEVEADFRALSIYVPLGYPVVEAIDSFTNFLRDSEETRARIAMIDDLCTKYSLTHYKDLYYQSYK